MNIGTVWPWIAHLYNYAWFVGFFVSGITYMLMMKKQSALEKDNEIAEALVVKPAAEV
jgi:cytosine/uracil/thiamine/allantoin permease